MEDEWINEWYVPIYNYGPKTKRWTFSFCLFTATFSHFQFVTFVIHIRTLSKKSTYSLLFICRFGLLPLSMSNVRKSKSASKAADAAHQLVSPRTGLWWQFWLQHALTVTVVLPFRLILSVTPSSTLHSALLSTGTSGKLIIAGCVCLVV